MLNDRIISKRLLPILKPRLHRLMKQAGPYAMVSRNRMQNLHRLLSRVERDGVAGDAVEAGVARGGSAIVITDTALRCDLDRQVWLYDAFDLIDRPPASYEQVRQTLFDVFRFDPQRVHVVRGLFDDTVCTFPDRPIAFVHIDAAHYEAVKPCLDAFFWKLSAGGWVVFDNYGTQAGCRRAVDELLESHGLAGRLERFGHSQAFVQKRA